MKEKIKKLTSLICDEVLKNKKIVSLINKSGLTNLTEAYINNFLSVLLLNRFVMEDTTKHQTLLDAYGGIMYRRFELENVGDIVKSHSHTYDHFTFIHKGPVDVNGVIYDSGQWVRVPKEALHTIKALGNKCEFFCINSEYEALVE